MTSWECIEHTEVPNGGRTLMLASDGEGFMISLDGRELMGTAQHGSEVALADQACDRLEALDDARILVGGLGMGFTLAAVLRRLGPAGVATVAELVPEVVRWAENHFGHVAGHPLRDSRVEVHLGDVFQLMQAPPTPWHAILLDVDNGPHAFTHASNDELYTNYGLECAWNALEPGGILAVWSSAPYPFFTGRLREVGFETEVIEHAIPQTFSDEKWCQHVLWMARRPVGSPASPAPVCRSRGTNDAVDSPIGQRTVGDQHHEPPHHREGV